MSRDPIQERGGVNLFSFVQNNAASLIDRLGLDPVPLDSGGTRQVIPFPEAYSKIYPDGKVPPADLERLNKGCIGLTGIYQGCGQPPYEPFPEWNKDTECFLTERDAQRRICPDGKNNFVFAKQGKSKTGKIPEVDPKTQQVPKDSIRDDGGVYNYVTTFPETGTYAWIDEGIGYGPTPNPQNLILSPRPPKDPKYPFTIWCSTCKCPSNQ